MNAKLSRRVVDRIDDIRMAMANIRSDLGDTSQSAFLSDGKTQRAIIGSLIVIGEAAARILQAEPSLETGQPGAWQHLRDANGMRNLMAHEYFRIDPAVVWDTIQNDLPVLDAALNELAGHAESATDALSAATPSCLTPLSFPPN
jgi:uncharacterized protein with HEPN domain